MKNYLKEIVSILLAGGLLLGTATVWGQAKVDPKLKSYEKTSGVAGNLNCVGSDTLNNLMTLWAEGFRKNIPV